MDAFVRGMDEGHGLSTPITMISAFGVSVREYSPAGSHAPRHGIRAGDLRVLHIGQALEERRDGPSAHECGNSAAAGPGGVQSSTDNGVSRSLQAFDPPVAR
jgi:hypothetical protein